MFGIRSFLRIITLCVMSLLTVSAYGDTPMTPAITIDATKTGAPISPYIYGQFIEHLGRCIYDGIWSEMLQDRKFYYPIDSVESPWKSCENTRLSMDTNNPFVNSHTPQITVDTNSAGIYQGDLGVQNGRAYTGYIYIKGNVPRIMIRLVCSETITDKQTATVENLNPNEYTKFSFSFTANADADLARLEITADSPGQFHVGAVSLMPADNIHGMRADTIALLKQLNAPIYRWPGGNFVSGYNWMDGIGDRDKRFTRRNPAWKGIDSNDFGMDEFMAFCREINTEPYISVNSGLGSAEDAANEVEYANGSTDTPIGALRAQNGHPDPYKVAWWSVGNEMYGDWQLGHIPVDQYAQKHNEFARLMKEVDSTIKLIGVGDSGKWSEAMLANCANNMDLLSEHFYCQDKSDLQEYVRQMPDNVKKKADAHRHYLKEIPSLAAKPVYIALDEWNYWHGAELYGELGTRYFLRDGLGIAAGLHEFFRNSDIFQMANYAQTVNVIGAIKTSKTQASMETTGLVLALYRAHFGTIPVSVDVDACAPLDVSAAWTADHAQLTLAVVNPTHTDYSLPVSLKGFDPQNTSIHQYLMTGSDEYAFNEPGAKPQVAIQESTFKQENSGLKVPAISVVMWIISK